MLKSLSVRPLSLSACPLKKQWKDRLYKFVNGKRSRKQNTLSKKQVYRGASNHAELFVLSEIVTLLYRDACSVVVNADTHGTDSSVEVDQENWVPCAAYVDLPGQTIQRSEFPGSDSNLGRKRMSDVLLFLGPDLEAWLEDGGYNSRAAQGDQDHEHWGICTYHDMAAESDQPVGADAGGTSVSNRRSKGDPGIRIRQIIWRWSIKPNGASGATVVYSTVLCWVTRETFLVTSLTCCLIWCVLGTSRRCLPISDSAVDPRESRHEVTPQSFFIIIFIFSSPNYLNWNVLRNVYSF